MQGSSCLTEKAFEVSANAALSRQFDLVRQLLRGRGKFAGTSVAHVAAILPSLQSASALPSAAPPAFGDDFAAVLAGLAPSTHISKEAPPQHAQPANDSVVQAAPVQPQPKPRTRPVPAIARADSKPAVKARAEAGRASSCARGGNTKSSRCRIPMKRMRRRSRLLWPRRPAAQPEIRDRRKEYCARAAEGFAGHRAGR